MERADLPAALALQSESYPAFLVESAVAFTSRLDVAAPYCLVAMRDGELLGYLLAHGWPRNSPPAVGAVLSADFPSEVIYIHDLSVAAAGRGESIGAQLVARAFELARRDGLEAAELIAVEGAASYWRRLGFVEGGESHMVAAKLVDYGPEARWMTRAIA